VDVVDSTELDIGFNVLPIIFFIYFLNVYCSFFHIWTCKRMNTSFLWKCCTYVLQIIRMSQLRDILCGYGHHMFQYIKCLVDQTESDGRVYSVQWVLHGFNVIGHVYTLRLCHTHSVEEAKDGATRAIALYIDFITQLSIMDMGNDGTCTSTSVPFTIGCKDAAQFVYKKIFSDTLVGCSIPNKPLSPSSSSSPTTIPPSAHNSNESTTCPKKVENEENTNEYHESDDIGSIQFVTYLETLHEYKQIIHNMIRILFNKDRFYDTSEKNGTTEYYSDAISKILSVNGILETMPINTLLYKQIVFEQSINNNNHHHTENMTPHEYVQWITNIMCPP